MGRFGRFVTGTGTAETPVAAGSITITPATLALESEGDGNAPPTAGFTYLADDLDLTVTDTSTDGDGTVAERRVAWGDDTESLIAAPGGTASHAYAAPGTYQVTLTATDNLGETDTDTQSVAITIPNAPPVAEFSVVTDELDATVTDASTDGDGTIASISIDWGDGSADSPIASAGGTATHTYAAAGTWTITSTVTDDDGAPATKVRAVTVSEPVDPPGGDAIELTASRHASGTASVTRSINMVPLLDNVLLPGQETSVRLLGPPNQNGVRAEVACYVEAALGLRPSGYLRCIYLEADLPNLDQATPLASRPVYVLDFAGATVARLTKQGHPAEPVRTYCPDASLLPTDPAYLSASEFAMAPTPLAADYGTAHDQTQRSAWEAAYLKHYTTAMAASAGSMIDRYEAPLGAWTLGWAYTGDPIWWERACRSASTWVYYLRTRDDPNKWITSSYKVMPLQHLVSYYATGYTGHLDAIAVYGVQKASSTTSAATSAYAPHGQMTDMRDMRALLAKYATALTGWTTLPAPYPNANVPSRTVPQLLQFLSWDIGGALGNFVISSDMGQPAGVVSTVAGGTITSKRSGSRGGPEVYTDDWSPVGRVLGKYRYDEDEGFGPADALHYDSAPAGRQQVYMLSMLSLYMYLMERNFSVTAFGGEANFPGDTLTHLQNAFGVWRERLQTSLHWILDTQIQGTGPVTFATGTFDHPRIAYLDKSKYDGTEYPAQSPVVRPNYFEEKYGENVATLDGTHSYGNKRWTLPHLAGLFMLSGALLNDTEIAAMGDEQWDFCASHTYDSNMKVLINDMEPEAFSVPYAKAAKAGRW